MLSPLLARDNLPTFHLKILKITTSQPIAGHQHRHLWASAATMSTLFECHRWFIDNYRPVTPGCTRWKVCGVATHGCHGDTKPNGKLLPRSRCVRVAHLDHKSANIWHRQLTRIVQVASFPVHRRVSHDCIRDKDTRYPLSDLGFVINSVYLVIWLCQCYGCFRFL